MALLCVYSELGPWQRFRRAWRWIDTQTTPKEEPSLQSFGADLVSNGQATEEFRRGWIGTTREWIMCLENHKCISFIRAEGLWEMRYVVWWSKDLNVRRTKGLIMFRILCLLRYERTYYIFLELFLRPILDGCISGGTKLIKNHIYKIYFIHRISEM